MSESSGRNGSVRTKIALFLGLCWIYTCIHLDRQMLSVLAEALKVDLALTDRQLGTLTGSAFSIVYALVGLHFGALADRTDRLRLVIVGACIWSVSAIAGGFASNYGELVGARAGVAVGDAIATAATISLMTEVAGTKYRARAASLFFACAFVGAGAAALLGGFIAAAGIFQSSYPTWRLTMMAAGVPGLLGALYLGFFRSNDVGWTVRGGGSSRAAGVLWCASLLAVLVQARVPANESVPISVCLAALSGAYWMLGLRSTEQGAFGATLGSTLFRWLLLTFAAVLFVDVSAEFWLFPYAQRRFGLDAAHVGTDLGMVLVGGGVVGCLLGGWIADAWRARTASGAAWVALGAILIEALAIGYALLATRYSDLVTAFTIMNIASGGWTAVAASLGFDIVPQQYRGTGVSMYFFVTTLLGPGLGPYVIGLISDRVGSLEMALATSILVMGVAVIGSIRIVRARMTGATT